MGGGEQPQQQQQTSQPAPRNYGQETRDTLQAQVDLAPQIYASESVYKPKYAQMDTEILRNQVAGDQGLLNLFETEVYPRTSKLEAGASAYQREADISDVERLGPRATAAFRAANPQQTELTDALNQEAMTGVGPTDIEAELQAQAMDDLKRKGRLSDEEMRAADQQIRGIFSQRGMMQSNPAIFSEALNRSDLTQKRLGQARAFGLDVDAAINARKGTDRAFRGTVAQFNQGSGLDPFMTILGRPATAGQMSQANFGNANYALNSRSRMFNPESPYAQDVNDSNFNAANAAYINSQNAAAARYGANQSQQGAMIGAGVGAVGAIAGAAILAA